MNALWRIELLGRLQASCRDRVITRFRRQKTAVLLAYLAARCGIGCWSTWVILPRRFAAEALSLGRGLAEPQLIAAVLMHIAANAHRSGDRNTANAALEECLSIYRELADQRGLAQALVNLALHCHHRDPAGARALFQEGKALFVALRDESAAAWAAAHAGNLAYYQGRCDETRSLAEECRALFHQQGDRHVVGAG
jgi:hypothetical protein